MSSLHHENILEDCFEIAMESFRINNKLTHEQLQELITISKGTYDAICNSAYKIFQDICRFYPLSCIMDIYETNFFYYVN